MSNSHANSCKANPLAVFIQPWQNPKCAYVMVQNKMILRNKAISRINNQFSVIFHVLQSITKAYSKPRPVFSSNQEILRVLWDLKFHCSVLSLKQLNPLPNHMTQVAPSYPIYL
jgi:hypothetical protein